MKIAIITDQHFGARKGSKIFHDYFLKFYEEVFFPTLAKEGVSAVIDLGDTFDNRKSIDLWSMNWAQKNYYDRLKQMKLHVWTVVGNHTSYYKNTNELNTIDVLLKNYDNVTKISEPTEVHFEDCPVLFLPWINQENEEITKKLIKNTSAKVAMGHLELNGFAVMRGMYCEHGMDKSILSKFDRVFSGHYHTRSSDGKIFYLGNPYELYWNDVYDNRGFHIFDTETLEHTPVNNPFNIFQKIQYEDTPWQTFNFSEYENKFVKLIVRKKTDEKQFEKFFESLTKTNCHEVKVVENFAIEENIDFEALETEDTISTLNRYIENSEIDLNKTKIKKYLRSIYKEACEVE